MLLTALGTAQPYPRPGEPCSGYLLQSDPDADGRRASVWIDAGSGTLAELQRHIPLDELDAVFISHRHADHSSDLLVAYYALRFADRRPGVPIPLFAPEGMLVRLADFLGPGSAAGLARVFDDRPMSAFGESVVGGLRLEWAPVQHGVPACGLTVDEGSRRFAYSGDSAPCISLEEIGEGTHVYLIEAGYDRPPAGEEPAHLTPEDAGRAAASAGAARLVLTHLADGLTPERAAERAATVFPGPIEVARPGSVIPI